MACAFEHVADHIVEQWNNFVADGTISGWNLVGGAWNHSSKHEGMMPLVEEMRRGMKRRHSEMSTSNESQSNQIESVKPLIPPGCLLDEIPLTDFNRDLVDTTRKEISAILSGEDDRILCIVGPCSIHDPEAALEYARFLAAMREEYKNELLIVMRVYFEKPRTTVGWKGLINDPMLDGSFMINTGLRIGRQLLADINEMGLPCAIEFLDVFSPQYMADLVSWGAIGARTTESQVHREMASGLPCPIGFKNGTTGHAGIAVDAILASREPHHFVGSTKFGTTAVIHTSGNPDAHIVLRGGSLTGPNYKAENVEQTVTDLQKGGIAMKVVVDCSHGNSLKLHTNQAKVCADIAMQVASRSNRIGGVMVESNLAAGAQKFSVGVTRPAKLVRGQSITDACVDLDTTREMMANLARSVTIARLPTESEIADVGGPCPMILGRTSDPRVECKPEALPEVAAITVMDAGTCLCQHMGMWYGETGGTLI